GDDDHGAGQVELRGAGGARDREDGGEGGGEGQSAGERSWGVHRRTLSRSDAPRGNGFSGRSAARTTRSVEFGRSHGGAWERGRPSGWKARFTRGHRVAFVPATVSTSTCGLGGSGWAMAARAAARAVAATGGQNTPSAIVSPAQAATVT